MKRTVKAWVAVYTGVATVLGIHYRLKDARSSFPNVARSRWRRAVLSYDDGRPAPRKRRKARRVK